jgi:aspartate carbamoyltransferase catalytic subunit
MREYRPIVIEELSQEQIDTVTVPIDGDAAGKNLLSMTQLSRDDIKDYFTEAAAAETLINDPRRIGANVLPFATTKAVMRQPSTRTGGSWADAMSKLGGSAHIISGMESSSEGKGESVADSNVAFATQADILGIRTRENHGPAFAAFKIHQETQWGRFDRIVPVINLGDGEREHPTQALGDLFTIDQKLEGISGKNIVIVGDHQSYRAHHSLMIGAAIMGANIIAVESPAAPVPDWIHDIVGSSLMQTSNLNEALRVADVLYMGRNPEEYNGTSEEERARNEKLRESFKEWHIDYDRLQLMPDDAIFMHPRPRTSEVNPNVDVDRRTVDVQQMRAMIPMRMAIIARHLGRSIVDHL